MGTAGRHRGGALAAAALALAALALAAAAAAAAASAAAAAALALALLGQLRDAPQGEGGGEAAVGGAVRRRAVRCGGGRCGC